MTLLRWQCHISRWWKTHLFPDGCLVPDILAVLRATRSRSKVLLGLLLSGSSMSMSGFLAEVGLVVCAWVCCHGFNLTAFLDKLRGYNLYRRLVLAPVFAPVDSHSIGCCSVLPVSWCFQEGQLWSWQHDGNVVNGWFQLCANGHVRTNFKSVNVAPGWYQLDDFRVVVSFGNCAHTLELFVASMDTTTPSFVVRSRDMLDGRVARLARAPLTSGSLLTTHVGRA